MNKIDMYREKLATLQHWDEFLLRESGLPGPRGNIELGQAVADLGDEALFLRYLTYTVDKAPINSPEEFLAFCGVLGLGKLLANGRLDVLPRLRLAASDPRWRTREGVAMALQRFGDVHLSDLIDEMERWCAGNLLEQRAAAAAVCEPRFLKDASSTVRVLDILDRITESFLHSNADRKSPEFQALRKGMGYCWSVAVAALPSEGKKRMERWFRSDNPDILRVMRENLKKNRLERADAEWVKFWQEKLAK
ncbi:MAG: hypothetical protein ACOY90_08685 [Candidatus Zhuqueibacterota bacterium]